MSNKQSFDELFKGDTDVWAMMCDARGAKEPLKTSASHIVKSFSRTTHLLKKKNWTHNNKFSDLMELIASGSAKKIQNHLVYAPANNATFMPLEYVAKCINIITIASILTKWLFYILLV